MSLLELVGKYPVKSFRLFMIGFALFALGIASLYLNTYVFESHYKYIHYVAVVLVGLGCIVAIIGYIGLFAARLLILFNRGQR